MVIPRTSTKQAIDFLKFMKTLFWTDTKFNKYRIITDMHRMERKDEYDEWSEIIENEKAGATLVKELRNQGYKHEVCIFTGHPKKAIEACHELGCTENIRATKEFQECYEFANVINDSGKFGGFSKIRSMFNM